MVRFAPAKVHLYLRICTREKTMKVTDALSRASLDEKPEIYPEDMAHHVHLIVNQLPVSQSIIKLTIKLLLVISIVFGFFGTPCTQGV